ncbi:hypothetical protein [Azospirillum sp. B4]|uniref:hypothetical protein n=1 Tax=Azospirillum sp. B4 TaxID=95605 RepID=UPI000344F8DB|nr:hypothetical protein [Azospirillum sp. B4]
MTNVYSYPEKKTARDALFAFAVKSLEKEGWSVTRVPKGGKGSLRRITKDGKSYNVSIRTSQDAWIAFPRKADGEGWVTLDDVDYVVAVSLNDRRNPTKASVHMIPGNEARSRFDRAYAARKAAQHRLADGRGIWVSLYDKDEADPVNHVGAGMGLDYAPLAVWDLTKWGLPAGTEKLSQDGTDDGDEDEGGKVNEDHERAPLTISEAKRRLAETLGVPESAIKITIEH